MSSPTVSARKVSIINTGKNDAITKNLFVLVCTLRHTQKNPTKVYKVIKLNVFSLYANPKQKYFSTNRHLPFKQTHETPSHDLL